MKILRPELLVDIGWIAFTGGYVAVASQYPADGRLVPMTVGVVGLVLGILHFLGNFVPGMRPYTHGGDDEPDGTVLDEIAEDSNEDKLSRAERGPLKPGYLAAIGWGIGLVAGMKLIGAVWTMPIFFTLYFGIRGNRWVTGVVAGILMAVVTWGLFGELMGLELPTGLITSHLFALF